MDNEQTIEQKVVSFATSEHYPGAVELLKRSLTQVTTLVGEDEFHTVVNALTVELETALVQRFVLGINQIRTGENLTQPR
jgi:hypothetical protein